jgi:hypothetical protein
MKFSLVLVAILALALIVPMVTADDSISPTEDVTPIINDVTPVVIDTPIVVDTQLPIAALADVQYTQKTVSIITQILQWIGIEPQTEQVTTDTKSLVDVTVDGNLVATIPSDSKFANLKVHEVCMPYQYGTDGWYECEVSLQ